MHGEPCIYITPESVWVGTRHKRPVQGDRVAAQDGEGCREAGGGAQAGCAAPLRLFPRNEPPAVNAYNTFLAGSFKLDGPLPATIGSVTSTQRDVRLLRAEENMSNIDEANKLISQMLADVGKGLTPLICASSTKEASVAYKSALMKKIYLREHEEVHRQGEGGRAG